MTTILKKILPYGLALLAFSGVSEALPIRVPLIIIWTLNALIIASFLYARKFFPQKNMTLINLYLLWNICSIIRGCFVAEIYWDWKSLIGTAFGMFLPAFCYVFAMPNCNAILFKKLLKSAVFIFPLVLLLSPFSDRPGRYLTFFYLFMICITALPKKWKILTVAALLFSCFYDFDARSNIIRAAIAFLIGCLFFFRNHLTKYLKLAQRYIPIIPIILLLLGSTGAFNVFRMDEYLGNQTIEQNKDGEVKEVALTADTRTFLYEEVIHTAIDKHHILIGSTPARGYESFFFTFDSHEEREKGIRAGERYGTEVSVLNIFLHTGIIGVILYFLVFYYGSYLAVFKSQNTYIKLIGLFVVFRWCYGWIEDFNQFDINYAILWMFIAMCYSIHFRKMDNKQFKQWLLSIIKR